MTLEFGLGAKTQSILPKKYKKRTSPKGCYFGFNTRFEYLDEETIKWLAKANFRLF